MRPLWRMLPLRGPVEIPHQKQGEELGMQLPNASCDHQTGHGSIRQRDSRKGAAGGGRCTSKPRAGPALFLYFLGFQVRLFLKAGSIHKAGLEFNQQKSSLSHKEKALKSYYAAQSLHCFWVMLQHAAKVPGCYG